MSRRRILIGSIAALLAAGCTDTGDDAAGTPSPVTTTPTPRAGARTATPSPATTTVPTPAVDTSAAAVAARATVPVLCWHQLREYAPDDGAYAREVLICPPENFRSQLDALVSAGYTTISADEYLAHLTEAAPLPEKPVLLSFDDSQASQMSVGLPELLARDMSATFFVMTVPLDKPDWMSRDDVRTLADSGMTVAAHTWDHQRADRYSGGDWQIQLDEPRAELEKIIGGPVEHFAYPFGAWSPEGFSHLTDAGYRTAFQLQSDAIDATAPLLTLPRMLVGSNWTGPTLAERAAAMAAGTGT